MQNELYEKGVSNKYMDITQTELKEKIKYWTNGKRSYETPIAGLVLHNWEHPTKPTSYMMEPSICVIAQGSKRVIACDDIYTYDANHFLVTSLDLPVVADIIEASVETPFLGLSYTLNQKEIAKLLVDSSMILNRSKKGTSSMAVSEVSLSLLNAFLRLLDLLDEPDHIPVVVPLIEREILFRLLMSEQGTRLIEIGLFGSHEFQVARAIEWLKGNYNKPMSIDKLAIHVRMSTSALYYHFRELTNMSPLQYHKWLRLHEARRLMLTERLDASNAAFQVGYESPSQFSREYKRLFGNPPSRDIRILNSKIEIGS